MVFHIKLPGVINGQKWGKLSQIGFQVENMCNYTKYTYSKLTLHLQ